MFVKSEGVHQALNPSAYETVDFPSRKMNVETIEEAPGDSNAQKPQALEPPTFIQKSLQEESIPSPEKEELNYQKPRVNMVSQTPMQKKEKTVVKSPFVKPKNNIFYTEVDQEAVQQ